MLLAILGGGGFRVPLVYRAVAARPGLGIDRVVLYDTDPARLDVIAAVLAAVPGGPQVAVTTDLDRALHGVDVVFSAIRVGGAAGRAADERRALDLGVLGQETVGAGGLAYGLRTVPVALDIARRIAELAPEAWTINFTNPAGMITEAMRGVLGERVIGICDSPVGLIRRACRALGVTPQAVRCDYAGINHLGWLRAIHTGDGADLLPGLLADDAALARFEEGRLFGGPLLRAVGALPNEYVEFYYAHRDLAASLAAGTTRGEQVAADQAAFYAGGGGFGGGAGGAGGRGDGGGRAGGGDGVGGVTGDDDAAAPAARWERTRLRREQTYLAETRSAGEQRDAQDLSGGGYEQVALDLMAALAGGRPAELIVNVPNGSTLPQLPADMVIEVPSRVDSSGARALPVPPLDLHQLGLVAAVRAAERAVIGAVTQHSRELALRAFAIHPLVGSPRIAERLLESVLADHPSVAGLLR